MFGFVKELSQIGGLPLDLLKNECNINWVGKLVYVSNFIKILSYSSEQIVLKTKSGGIKIEGFDLTIAQLSTKEIILKGQIYLISRDKIPSKEGN